MFKRVLLALVIAGLLGLALILPLSSWAGPDLPGGSGAAVALVTSNGAETGLYADGLNGAVVSSRSFTVPYGSTVRVYREGDISGCAEIRNDSEGFRAYPAGATGGYPFAGGVRLCDTDLGYIYGNSGKAGVKPNMIASW